MNRFEIRTGNDKPDIKHGNEPKVRLPRLARLGFLYALTPIHAGSGQELSAVDLPIQRETHTEFPVLYSSSLKGCLREWYDRWCGVQDKGERLLATDVLFGGDVTIADEETKGMGMLSVSDGRILLFAVRSNVEPFVYITCPLVLRRFKSDLELAQAMTCRAGDYGVKEYGSGILSKVEKLLEHVGSFVGNRAKDAKAEGGSDESSEVARLMFSGKTSGAEVSRKAVLEDVTLDVVDERAEVQEIWNDIFSNMGVESDVVSAVFLVSDAVFKHLVKNATEVRAHIKIDSLSGTTEDGSLRYQEYLNERSILYFMAFFFSAVEDEAQRAVKSLEKRLGKYIQVGGDFTLGKGFCKLSWCDLG